MPETHKPAAYACGPKLAEARAARSLTQAALARQIGVSRQFLNQMESGRVLPNVVIALKLAAVLERSVELLFGESVHGDERVSVVLAEPDTALGTRLRLGRVGRQWVAHAADTPGTLAAGFMSADARLEENGQARWLVPRKSAETNQLLAGCDPALALLQTAPAIGSSERYHWIDCSSGRALDWLAAGLVHVAGIHYSGHAGAGNLAELKQRDPTGRWRAVRFTCWAQGWLLRQAARRRFAGITSLGTGNWRLANRDSSAAARRWLDRELATAHLAPVSIPGYAQPLASAAECAQAVASKQADVAVGPQALALAHGLDFVTAEAVDFDLIAPVGFWKSEAGRGLRARIMALAADGTLAYLPGYAATASGTERTRRMRGK